MTVNPPTSETPEDDDVLLESTTLSTQPAEVQSPSGLGVRSLLRWAWRQLTSMRTALLLLFLLALAAVPGSLLPQQGNAPADVADWISRHGALGRLFERLSLFHVYSSPWFAAVYLLLFVSLIGCVVPRTRLHWRALRSRPPAAPRNLSRLPVTRSFTTAATPQEVLDAAHRSLRRRRFRVDRLAGSVGAEKGYLRETGNLVFHLALVVLLVGVAIGALYGTRGNAIVVEGSGFANTVTRYDSFSAGPLADPQRLDPFSFTLDKFSATYQEGGKQNGAPRSFTADVTVQDSPTATPRSQVVQVNEPLVVGGTKVFLVGHGYAPVVTVRDGEGRVVFSDAVPFLPRDGMFTSTGVIKAPDARPTQLGFQGIFLPTASIDPVRGPLSTFPAANDPALFLSLWKGDLGLDTGAAQSVYRLDVSRMTRVGLKAMRPGESWTLPDGLGTITFDGVRQYAALSIAQDPGKGIALGSVVVAIAGLLLSLFVPRRRVWVRATADDEGTTLVEIGGLARTEAGGLEAEVDALRSDLPDEAAPGAREPIKEYR